MKGQRKAWRRRRKKYEDYAWNDLCEDPTKLKKLRVPELNKYLKHHRLDKHLKSTKNDKVKVITRYWLLQMNPEGTDPPQTSLRERDEAVNEPLENSDNDHSDEDDNGGSESSSEEENENDYIYSGDRDESKDVILAFIDDEEELARPATTRSGRSIIGRSEIDFSFFWFCNVQQIHSEVAQFFFADFIAYS